MAASTFLFHPLMNEVVPYNAVYDFPSQATRSTKRTIKITPKNSASSYVSGSTIRFEFPASGYLNPTTTYLGFNARAQIVSGAFTAGDTNRGGFAFQQNIASIFRRVRVLYGSLVLEDIQDFNILQRMFTEVLLPSGYSQGKAGMYQGIANLSNTQNAMVNAIQSPSIGEWQNDRLNYHSIEAEDNSAITEVGRAVRRYAIAMNTGVFQQKRLLPLKFMSSQLQIEFEIAPAIDCQIWIAGNGGSPAVPTDCRVEVGLPEIVAELLEFDSEFDRAVFEGLGRGLAIPFQSWHMNSFNISPGIFQQINIQESSRSVRYALAGMTDDNQRSLLRDAHLFFGGFDIDVAQKSGNTGAAINNLFGNAWINNGSCIESFQWRLGGVYYPSQPVPCYGGAASIGNSGNIDSSYADPPVEAYQELQKVFDNQFGKRYPTSDVCTNNFGGRRGTSDSESGAFVMACDFMTDRGDVVGGINAEEQNDMMLMLKFNGTTGGAKVLRVAICYDNIMILGESNNMVLVN